MKKLKVGCQDCGGDGRETCNNPDHGFILCSSGDIGRLGCPVCGHDPKHKVPGGGSCETCNGTGLVDDEDGELECPGCDGEGCEQCVQDFGKRLGGGP